MQIETWQQKQNNSCAKEYDISDLKTCDASQGSDHLLKVQSRLASYTKPLLTVQDYQDKLNKAAANK